MEYCPLRRGDKGPDQSPCTSTWLEVAIDVGGKKRCLAFGECYYCLTTNLP